VTVYTIEVRANAEQYDILARQVTREILQLLDRGDQQGLIHQHLTVRTAQLYHLTGTLSPSQLDQLTHTLLIDPVTQTAIISPSLDQDKNQAGSYTDTNQSVQPRTGYGRGLPPPWSPPWQSQANTIVDVFFHAGVTDTLAESVQTGASMLGIPGIEQVSTSRRYYLDGLLSAGEVRHITESLLYNPVIQQYKLHPVETRFMASAPGADAINRVSTSIPITSMSDAQLLDLSKKGLLALNLDEMRAIQRHFHEDGREPTDVELETLAQTWSEHCSHKTFKATIEYREVDASGNTLEQETINGLLKSYIMRATQQVARPWVVSAFSDNAGIVRFTETQDIAFKVETHNHPSAIEPFGGANTGVGGVIRDVLGVSAQPIACTDILCFGPPDTPSAELPAGLLTPRRIAGGVVNGVRDYGNKMGIPTVNGAILYHPGYIFNPLVFCGCLGLLPRNSHPRSVQPGDRIVVLGGRTGRDGIHGATFSSGEMSIETNAQAGSAVQIGAPITGKKVADVVIQARDRKLYSAITDCGAGGFSSAIGEMGADTGAYVELEKAPLKYQGLTPWEIWLSEAQERMVLAVPPQHLEDLLAICAIEEVEASIIGTFTNSHHLIVTDHGQTVANLPMSFLHDGRPNRTLEALWIHKSNINAKSIAPARGAMDFALILINLLRHPTIASKESVVRRYDHEVQGATVLKPLVGLAGNGPGDAAILQPILEEQSKAGIILSNGINPLYGQFDPYWMAMNAVDEALRNLTAVGGDIERAAILDNFCWGNPTDPAQLGMLVRAVKGCHDAAIGFGVPFISGKDSLNNEYRANGQRLPVIPTLLISALGVIDDAAQSVDMSLKQPGNLLYLIGQTHNELAGSHYLEVSLTESRARAGASPARTLLRSDGQSRAGYGRTPSPWPPPWSDESEATIPGTSVPHVDVATARNTMNAVGNAIRAGLVQSCHDLSEGGLAVAAAEMALAGLLGLTIAIEHMPRQPLEYPDASQATILLFGESASRFLIEVAPQQQEAFEAHMQAYHVRDIACLGSVTESGRFQVRQGNRLLIDLAVDELQTAWKGDPA
jgi:phosphoribosylformylglycinamidine synthase subunit PurSL